MPITTTARLLLKRWSDDGDAWDRADFDNNSAQLEELAAIGRQDVIANRGAAATYPRSLFYATDQLSLWWSTGAVWRLISQPNANSGPQLSTIGHGAMIDDAITHIGEPQSLLITEMPILGGTTLSSVAIAKGAGEVTVDHLWMAVYNASTGVKLGVTDDYASQIVSSNSTTSVPFAGAGLTIPTTGRYTFVVYADSSTNAPFGIAGAACPTALSKTSKKSGMAGLSTPATAPVDLAAIGGIVLSAAIPWLGIYASF